MIYFGYYTPINKNEWFVYSKVKKCLSAQCMIGGDWL